MSAFVELQPVTHNGPIPRPLPPCTDPTPDEQYRLGVAAKEAKLARREQELAREEASQANVRGDDSSVRSAIQNFTDGASGIYNSLKTTAAQVALNLERSAAGLTATTESQVRQFDHQQGIERFRQYFPELFQDGEVLLASYRCCAMHAGTRLNGHVLVTPHYLLFIAQQSSVLVDATHALLASVNATASERAPPSGIRQIIPFSEVASLQPSVALETVNHGSPYFILSPASNVLATAIQVYTTNKDRVYQFTNFDGILSRATETLSDDLKGTSLSRFYNYADHSWRHCVSVPLEGVQYA